MRSTAARPVFQIAASLSEVCGGCLQIAFAWSKGLRRCYGLVDGWVGLANVVRAMARDDTKLSVAEQMRFPSEPFVLRAGRVLWHAYDRTLAPLLRKLFLLDLIVET